ncbi:MAG TPA: LamG domain-containing protein [Verrucomicrobiales bacterium]|nr:LamG domain-containing protein [Verrucomicrobiales bacterium]HIL68901.1 LamG domain-containing protein [Verrucomicrobiota bacterium]
MTAVPKVDVGPTLAFGLYLVGEDYHELELPLDGQDGRPSLSELTDGEIHHFVATYDTDSGKKRLFIDGVLATEYGYPTGTRILSGGSGRATIGNSPIGGGEPFTGIIDEVAFYDIALPEFTVRLHFESIDSGNNYFGMKPGIQALSTDFPGIVLPQNVLIRLDRRTGLPEILLETKKTE